MEKIIEKIAQYRNKKGFTYENMADELELTPAAYRKIETGETKLTVERLFRISAILETPINEILELDKVSLQQNNYNANGVYQQKIEHFYQENKEITEQLIKAKDQLIEQLQKEIAFLKGRNYTGGE
ncbi:helix-turn-helix transcriptional regulator [Bergeyella porcorum]|uniref:helix-turn-helix transcriptional regulator n=1 Tax=Bergeyella porcorum TaxID=1735111 RepID=UPI0035EC9F60